MRMWDYSGSQKGTKVDFRPRKREMLASIIADLMMILKSNLTETKLWLSRKLGI